MKELYEDSNNWWWFTTLFFLLNPLQCQTVPQQQFSAPWQQVPWSNTWAQLTSQRKTLCVSVGSPSCTSGPWSRVGAWRYRRACVRRRGSSMEVWVTGRSFIARDQTCWTSVAWTYGNTELQLPVCVRPQTVQWCYIGKETSFPTLSIDLFTWRLKQLCLRKSNMKILSSHIVRHPWLAMIKSVIALYWIKYKPFDKNC